MKPLLNRATKFGLVGLITVSVYFVILAVFRHIVSSVFLLSALAYVGSSAFNFMAHSKYTFGVNFANVRIFGRYVVMHMVCMLLNSAFMFGLVEIANNELYQSQIFVTIIIAATSFLLSHYWIYREAD